MSDLSAPPIEPSPWRFEQKNGTGSVIVLWQKTWFYARQEACKHLRCEPGDVVCVERPV